MAEFPPRSCGECPHIAHFRKAADPKHYIPEQTVPLPNFDYQQNIDLRPQLGATNTYNPPTLKVPPVVAEKCNAPCCAHEDHRGEGISQRPSSLKAPPQMHSGQNCNEPCCAGHGDTNTQYPPSNSPQMNAQNCNAPCCAHEGNQGNRNAQLPALNAPHMSALNCNAPCCAHEDHQGGTNAQHPPQVNAQDCNAPCCAGHKDRQAADQIYTGGIPPCNIPCSYPQVVLPQEPCPDTPYSLQNAIPKSPCDKVQLQIPKSILKKPEAMAQQAQSAPPMPMPQGMEDPGSEKPWASNPDERVPCYLPQPEDKIPINKNEGMGPIGPWATGRVDWGPLKGLTGTRPVVDRYSIARYSEGEWRQHNKEILEGKSERAIQRNNLIEWNGRQCMAQTQAEASKNQEDSTRRLHQREKEIHRWKCELERAIAAASEEISFMEEQRRRLKQAAAVLQLPESIAGECLERRTGRLDSELVRDEVEVELIKERALCDEIRQQFQQTLKDVELQLIEDKTAKQRLEYDWSDKKHALELDSTARGLTLRSSILMFKPGSVIFPGDQSTPEYWEHFTKETLQMSEATRQRSVTLRGTLDAILINASRDLRTQADKVELILSKRIRCLIEVIDRLEAELKKILQKLADVEKLIDDLREAIRRLDLCLKKAQTRLDLRLQRKRVENCRDPAHFGLIEEVKMIGEQSAALAAQLKQAEDSLAELIIGRNELENEIMRKRKTLEIDRGRIQQFRSFYPSATALSGYA